MNGIFWLKKHSIVTSKARMILFICIPILSILLMNYLEIESYLIGLSYMIACVCFQNFVVFFVEDIVFSEALLSSSMSLKKLWIYSFISNYALTVMYPQLVLIMYVFIKGTQISQTLILGNILALFYIAAIQLITTVHLCDYSKSKQLISSVFGLLNISLSLYLMLKLKQLSLMETNGLLFFGVSFFLVFLILFVSFKLFKKGNVEKLLINTKPLAASVKDNSNLYLE